MTGPLDWRPAIADAPGDASFDSPSAWRAGVPVPSRILGIALVAVLGVTVAHCARSPGRPDRGPIILISVDSLRADHLPAYGYRDARTPTIDGLVADGVVFEHAFAHVPQTLPSHASILSGQLPFEHGVRDEIGFTIGPDVPLLPEQLRRVGFATGGVVSSYLLRSETGVGRGFGWFDDTESGRPTTAEAGGTSRSGSLSLARARQWLQSRDSPRFFLFLHIDEPRAPYEPPARHADLAPYDGEVAAADDVVAGLVATLREHGWYDQATIVLLSDHGESLGDHGELHHGLFVYAETMRVPLVVKLPLGLGRGRRVRTPVQHIDVAPTLLDLAGAPLPDGLRGRSLVPLLESPRGLIADQFIYGESLSARYHFGWSELISVTDEQYRFIKTRRPELFDMRDDPGDCHNIIENHALTAAVMRNAVDALLEGKTIPQPGAVSADVLQRLRAVGVPVAQAGIPSDVPGDTLPDPKDGVKAGERKGSDR